MSAASIETGPPASDIPAFRLMPAPVLASPVTTAMVPPEVDSETPDDSRRLPLVDAAVPENKLMLPELSAPSVDWINTDPLDCCADGPLSNVI